jgi:uncharacterized protein (TIGR02646 family)
LGAHFSAYCEQVAAKDIEHFYPKADYPRKMFLWTNFLRGCKNCNNAKRDRFPVNGGRAILIDPCSEDPLDFLLWDFVTGRAALNPNEPNHSRAQATRDLFDLDQEPLREERRLKLREVIYVMTNVVNEDSVSERTKEQLRDHLLPHRPWLGIVRQLLEKPGLYASLVDAARKKIPEIQDWTASWL